MTLDKNRLELRRDLTPVQVDQLVDLFQQEWWTKGRQKADVEKLMGNAGPIFAFIDPLNEELVAFARAMTDGVYKAMIFDIIVKDTWRNTGLGRLLMETVMTDPRPLASQASRTLLPRGHGALLRKMGLHGQSARPLLHASVVLS